jgi:hypothetical protein
MLSFLTVGKSILFDGLSKKPRRACRPQAANNFDRFLPRHVRGRKHFARSERLACPLSADNSRRRAQRILLEKVAKPLFRQAKEEVPIGNLFLF